MTENVSCHTVSATWSPLWGVELAVEFHEPPGAPCRVEDYCAAADWLTDDTAEGCTTSGEFPLCDGMYTRIPGLELTGEPRAS